MKAFTLTSVFIFYITSAISQISIHILSVLDSLPLSEIVVYTEQTNSFGVSDLSGNVTINPANHERVIIQSLHFEDTVLLVDQLPSSKTIYLNPKQFKLPEVVVEDTVLIDKIIENAVKKYYDGITNSKPLSYNFYSAEQNPGFEGYIQCQLTFEEKNKTLNKLDYNVRQYYSENTISDFEFKKGFDQVENILYPLNLKNSLGRHASKALNYILEDIVVNGQPCYRIYKLHEGIITFECRIRKSDYRVLYLKDTIGSLDTFHDENNRPILSSSLFWEIRFNNSGPYIPQEISFFGIVYEQDKKGEWQLIGKSFASLDLCKN